MCGAQTPTHEAVSRLKCVVGVSSFGVFDFSKISVVDGPFIVEVARRAFGGDWIASGERTLRTHVGKVRKFGNVQIVALTRHTAL